MLPEDAVIESEIQDALSTTLRSLAATTQAGQNFSLCHGLLGNAELPLSGYAKVIGQLLKKDVGFWPDFRVVMSKNFCVPA